MNRLLFFCCCLVLGCGSSVINSLQNEGRVTITNLLTINGQQYHNLEISADGKQMAVLDYGESVSSDFPLGTHRFTASSSEFQGDATFNLTMNNKGAHTRLNISAEQITTGSHTVRFFCENCE